MENNDHHRLVPNPLSPDASSRSHAYSSGKLGDWYPDLLDAATGRLVLYEAKPGWQRGWFAQHQRLIEA